MVEEQQIESHLRAFIASQPELLNRIERVEVRVFFKAQKNDPQPLLIKQILGRFSDSNITEEDILGASRKPSIVDRRYMAIATMRSEGMTLHQIANVFNRDHTTILHALEQHQNRRTYEKKYRQLYDLLSL